MILAFWRWIDSTRRVEAQHVDACGAGAGHPVELKCHAPAPPQHFLNFLPLPQLQTDADGNSALAIAWQKGSDAVVAVIATHSKPALAELLKEDLTVVFKSGYALTAKALIANGLALNEPLASGLTPLVAATQGQGADMAKSLMEAGANPNTVCTLQGISNVSPLMMAAASDNLDAARLLLERGADRATVASNGATVRSIASSRRNFQMEQLLDAL